MESSEDPLQVMLNGMFGFRGPAADVSGRVGLSWRGFVGVGDRQSESKGERRAGEARRAGRDSVDVHELATAASRRARATARCGMGL